LGYILLYTGLLGLAAFIWRRQAADMVRSNPLPLLFTLIYFPAYLLLYFWYAPIAAGNRLVLAQFLPLMYSLSCGLSALLKDKSICLAGRRVGLLTAMNLLILPFLLLEVNHVLTNRIWTITGGD
jgi:hypothetical protein